LNSATVQDAVDFFRIYYAPNNAVLTLVGDFQTDVALNLIQKYFESIPAQPVPPAPDVAEPEQKAERRKVIEDAFAQAPRLDIVYKAPAGNTPDWYALAVLGQVLSGGVSSRLYQKLIKDKEVALSASAGPDERRGPSLFWFSIRARPGTDLAALEKLVYEEIEQVQKEEIADWELTKVQMQLRRQRAQQRYSTRARANAFGHYAVYYNDPQLINSAQHKYNQVTRADLQRVARAYLMESQRSVVMTVPKPAAANAPSNQ
jgi:predicted Zn-dependent peptidase